MSNLANGRVNLKFNNSVLGQKSVSSFGTVKLVRNAIKTKFTYNG